MDQLDRIACERMNLRHRYTRDRIGWAAARRPSGLVPPRQSIKGSDTVGEVMGSAWERGGVGRHPVPEVSHVAPPPAAAPVCA
jgi:hypothetical protein